MYNHQDETTTGGAGNVIVKKLARYIPLALICEDFGEVFECRQHASLTLLLPNTVSVFESAVCGLIMGLPGQVLRNSKYNSTATA